VKDLQKWSLIFGFCAMGVGAANPVLANVSANKVAAENATEANINLSNSLGTIIAQTYTEETVEVTEEYVEEVIVEEYTEETVEITEEVSEEYIEEVIVEEYTEETIETVEIIEEYSE
jgi:hypothetical protein